MKLALVPLALTLVLWPGWVEAAQQESGSTAAGSEARLPPDIDVAFGQLRQNEDGSLLMTGSVTVDWRESRIQADRVSMTGQRYLVAEGNVLIVWGGNRIFGTRMTYDLEEERGIIENAIGNVEGDFLFFAKSIEKIGERKVRLRSAQVTTCTQPVPYWSFAVSRATITIDNYARMRNIRFRAGKVPIIYLPYIVWPVKQDRAAGLLFPEFQSNEERGFAYSQEVFVPLGRSADVTLLGKYFTKAGFGFGGQARLIPNRRGAASLSGFVIRDKVGSLPGVEPNSLRYSVSYNQTQEFLNGFRMVADINLVSDFNYFSDYERDLSLASSPTILARLEFTRNGRWTSMNVRELRREQLLSNGETLVQQTLPEIEWRGRSLRLGRTPFYLAYEASAASIRQEGFQTGQPIDADYLRGDVFPQISVPLSPVPWLDITPQASYRLTSYTQRQDFVDLGDGLTKRVISDESITRDLFGAGVEIVGPKIVRIFDRPNKPGAAKFKHSIEPSLIYGYQDEFDELENLIVFDEVDRFAGAGNSMSYALVQRLFAKRPREEQEPARGQMETVLLPDGTTSETPLERVNGEPPATLDPTALPPEEPLEIASLELRQRRSFDRDDISSADFDRDGVNEASSPYSSIIMIGRYNPNRNTSLDLRTDYHILYDRFSGATLSGGLRSQLAAIRFSLVHRTGLGVRRVGDSDPNDPTFEDVPDNTQLRLTTGLNLLRGKLKLNLDGSFIFNPAPGEKSFPDRRWRVEYTSQCCTVLLERINRQFESLADRSDYYFRIDLQGIGKLIDVKY